MLNAVLTTVDGVATLIGAIVPLTIAGLALRRAMLSYTHNFVRYLAMAFLATLVADVNVFFASSIPAMVPITSSVAMVAGWMLLREACDIRRRHSAMRRAAGAVRRY